MVPDKDPRWQRYAALTMLAGLVAALIVFRGRLADDFWPLDSSRIGPNLVASIVQTVVVLVVAALIWPPTRRRIRRFIDRRFQHVHERIDELHVRHEAHATHAQAHSDRLDVAIKRIEALHRKLDRQARAKEE